MAEQPKQTSSRFARIDPGAEIDARINRYSRDADALRETSLDRADGAGWGGGGGSGGSSSPGAAATKIDQAGGTGTPTYGALAGAINGSNAVFTVSSGYYVSGTVMVWLNGVLVCQGTGSNEWSETSATAGTVTFGTAPQSGDWILMQYGV
jgi:hypothetical protein